MRPKLPPDYEKLSDEWAGTRVRLLLDVEFANGCVHRKGEEGVVRWIEPGAERNHWSVRLEYCEDDTVHERGVKSFTKDQLEFLPEDGRLP